MSKTPDLLRAKADKSLGQHFLFDPDILKRTALAAGLVERRSVLEIGPGPGGLTRALLDNGVQKLVCIEMDERFASALQEWPECNDGRLAIERADAMEIKWEELIQRYNLTPPVMIVANLPYNVGTPLLVNWLKAGNWRGEMALMFQKEVAQRICAAPDSPHYGRLAVLAQAVTRPKLAFTLPPGAFKPPPKVASAVAVLSPLSAQERFDDLEAIQTVTAAAFGQRRKMLRRSLKPILPPNLNAEAFLSSLEIMPTARAETLNQIQFRRMATAWRGLQES